MFVLTDYLFHQINFVATQSKAMTTTWSPEKTTGYRPNQTTVCSHRCQNRNYLIDNCFICCAFFFFSFLVFTSSCYLFVYVIYMCMLFFRWGDNELLVCFKMYLGCELEPTVLEIWQHFWFIKTKFLKSDKCWALFIVKK